MRSSASASEVSGLRLRRRHFSLLRHDGRARLCQQVVEVAVAVAVIVALAVITLTSDSSYELVARTGK
jgi:hypothetical protein